MGKLCSRLHLLSRSESSRRASEVTLREPNAGTERFEQSCEGRRGEDPDKHRCWQQDLLNHACGCLGLQTDRTHLARLEVNNSIRQSTHTPTWKRERHRKPPAEQYFMSARFKNCYRCVLEKHAQRCHRHFFQNKTIFLKETRFVKLDVKPLIQHDILNIPYSFHLH